MEHRATVDRFADYMERELQRHDDRGTEGWRNCDPMWLLQRLREEVDELEQAIRQKKHVVCEAADVGNFAMMIADNAADLYAGVYDQPRGSST